jgi:aminopeptidase N
VQSLATTLLLANVAAHGQGAALCEDDSIIEALAAVLSNSSLEPALVAQTLAVPSEADVARDLGRNVDPDAIFAARVALRGTIGRRLGPALRETYQRMSDSKPYSPDATSAGRRALKNTCLDLLVASGEATTIALAARQYRTADNMTDQMAALATLSLRDVPERQAALDDFYRRFSSDPLVIDKWLALQATIPESATLERVRGLAKHSVFSLANPNRVRALIGSFAQGNQTQFNRIDGEGYAFVADTVLTLQAKNPQVAARLMTAFRSWRALEPVRRTNAEATLRRVAGFTGLSRDVKDIVDRSLAGD